MPQDDEFEYELWRHGGWYVTNIRYPSGACGCVSNNYPDKKWRIACDPREGDHTYATRKDAARAERDLVAELHKESQMRLYAKLLQIGLDQYFFVGTREDSIDKEILAFLLERKMIEPGVSLHDWYEEAPAFVYLWAAQEPARIAQDDARAINSGTLYRAM